ncbi:sensor histidine kinase [Hydrotalea sandarakina]|jgi:PAS domain S-box-containing protein|uniref:histidine kinase n=1 Tax=Hydrotalea sandarakina TaxID=1004304 RepID=A0A2W7RSI5_9BACT|nr:PAS domain S-box protein [Hydrotalea sandarakina]PZX63653.1 PAS domain S-box-containing protein [Hydrotalea sandarakina]
MRSKNMLSNSKLSKNIPQTPKNIFEEIFLQSTVSTQILDKEGWCVRINKKLSEIFGVLPEDIEGKKYNIFQDAEIKKHGIDKLLKKVYTEKSIEQWEVFFNIDNASKSQNIPIALPVTKWFSNTAYPVLNENGELENVIIQHQDITLQKENSLRLKASEESLQKIFNSSPVGLLLSNTENEEIIMVNRAVEQLIGLPSKKIVGKSVAYFLADKADQKKYVTSIKQFGKVRNMEVALKKANNQLVTCYASGDVVEMNGESLFLTGIVNISELKQTQYALQQSEAKFKNLIEDLQVGLLVMDEHAKILMFNKAASNLLGYSSEQLLGKSAYDTDWKVIRDDGTFMPGNEFPVPIVVETLQPVHNCTMGMYRPLYHDWIWLLVDAIPVFDENHNLQQIICTFSDITEKKQLEKQIQNQQIKEQQLITEAIIQSQEEQREEMGRELHDNINQLLAGAKIYLDMAIKNASMSHDLMYKSMDILDKAIQEIRKISKMLVAPSLEEDSLQLLVKDLVNTLNNNGVVKFKFVFDNFIEEGLSKNIKLVLYRIIQEQMNNILKHAKATEAVIELNSENGYVYLTLKDNGQGFDTSAKPKGIGLRNIANRLLLNNGKMYIDSSPGNGCTLHASILIENDDERL